MSVSGAFAANTSSGYGRPSASYDRVLKRLGVPTAVWPKLQPHFGTLEELFESDEPALMFRGKDPYEPGRGPGGAFPASTAALARDLARWAPEQAFSVLAVVLRYTDDEVLQGDVARALSQACAGSPDAKSKWAGVAAWDKARAMDDIGKLVEASRGPHPQPLSPSSFKPAPVLCRQVAVLFFRALAAGDGEVAAAALAGLANWPDQPLLEICQHAGAAHVPEKLEVQQDGPGDDQANVPATGLRAVAKYVPQHSRVAQASAVAMDDELPELPADEPSVPHSPAETLAQAVRQGRLDEVKRFLGGEGAHALNALLMPEGSTALRLAAFHGRTDIVRFLLGQGRIDVNKTDLRANTPLHAAACGGHLDIVRMLLAGGGNIDAKGDDGVTALARAIFSGRNDVAKCLLEKGADPSLDDDRGNTPLHFAARLGNLEIADLLLDKPKTQVDAKDYMGGSPLRLAAWHGQAGIVELLLVKGKADVNLRDRTGFSPLCAALVSAKERGVPVDALHRIVRLLLRRQEIDLTASSQYGETALHMAANQGDGDIVNAILKAPLTIAQSRALANARDCWGIRPYALAIEVGMEAGALSSLMEATDIDEAQDEPSPERDDSRAGFILGGDLPNFPLAKLRWKMLKGRMGLIEHGNGVQTMDFSRLARLPAAPGTLKLALFHGGPANSNLYSLSPARPIISGDRTQFVPMVEALRAICATKPRKIKFYCCHSLLVVERLMRRMNEDPEWPKPLPEEIVIVGSKHLQLADAAQDDVLNDFDDAIAEKHGGPGGTMEKRTIDGMRTLKVNALTGQVEVERKRFEKAPKELTAHQVQRKKDYQLAKRAVRRNLTKLKQSVKHGADINFVSSFGVTALRHAALGGWKEGVEYLLSQPGIDPHKTGRGGWSPLMCACDAGRHDVVAVMLEKLGADGYRAMPGRYPFEVACKNGHAEVVSLLLKKLGPAALDRSDSLQRSFFAAVGNGHKEVVAALLKDAGLDVNSTEEGETALHLAAARGDTSLVRYLLAQPGVKIGPRNFQDKTPLALARRYGHAKIVALLEDARNTRRAAKTAHA